MGLLTLTLSVKSPDVLSNKSDVTINVAFMQIVMCMLVPRPQFLETYSGKSFNPVSRFRVTPPEPRGPI